MPVTKSITLALLTIATLSSTAVAQQRIAVTKDTAARDTTTKVEMLFVQSAKGATLENGKLTLNGVGPTTVFFSDRPKRIAGHERCARSQS